MAGVRAGAARGRAGGGGVRLHPYGDVARRGGGVQAVPALRRGAGMTRAGQVARLRAELDRRGLGLAGAGGAPPPGLSLSTADRPRFVAGSMGPTTKAISVTGGVTFEQLIEHYQAQAQGLHEGGVDYFLLETSQDTRNVKAGLIGIDRFQETLSPEDRVPVAVSGTIEALGTMLAGQSVDALAISLQHPDP